MIGQILVKEHNWAYLLLIFVALVALVALATDVAGVIFSQDRRQENCLLSWGAFYFYEDEFIMHRQIRMSQMCQAHNSRAVQKNETHPLSWQI